MPIITVSRQLGSLGTDIAQLLCKRFQYQCLDKELLEGAFGEYGIPRESVERFDEKKPGFWDIFKTDKARYLHFVKGAIYGFARKGNCVILGRGGQVALGNIPGILHVRVVAPMAKRIERIAKRLDCDERQAAKIIDQNDQERGGFHKFFFDCNWEDADLYDLVLNTGSLSGEAAARIIQDVANSDEFTARQKETLLKLDDLTLEHEIKTNIIYKEKLSIHFLEVFCEQGIVTLRGIAGDSRDVEESEKIAAGMKNVKEVHNE
ncbi:MAG: hypothetical protein QG657_4910, partial [Acidobacteriota bacterium]|nr:hypothetical protein [Acidobacteriota bacterium]